VTRVEILNVRPSLAESTPSKRGGLDRLQAIVSVLTDNGVLAFSRYADVNAHVRFGDVVSTQNAVWVSSTYPSVGIVTMVSGAFPADTATSHAVHAVISENLANDLGLTPSTAVGVRLDYVDAQTIGADPAIGIYRPLVIDGVASRIGAGQDPIDLLFVSDLERLPGFSELGASWLVGAPPEERVNLEQLVASVRMPDSTGPAFNVQRIDIGESLSPLLDQQRVTARAVAAIALTIGSLGLIGIGLAGTRERAQEYGIRRAIGVSTRKIFAGVVIQTVIEAMLASMLGIALSFIVAQFAVRQLVLSQLPAPSAVDLPSASVARGVGAAILVGVIASLIPAYRAARLSVSQAMRS
jgi:hypothetical protein